MTRRAALALAALVCAGCGDDPTATIALELAPTPGPSGGLCTAEADFEPDPLSADFFHFTICRETGADDGVPCYERSVVSQNVEGAADAGVAGVFVGPNVAFDAKVSGSGPYRIEVVACEGDDPIARGFAEVPKIEGESLRIRLYRYDAVSCAGPRRDGDSISLPAPRAFHAMTRMSNGDILVYGGVTGEAVNHPSGDLTAWEGLSLQPAVEVYRPSEERFLPVAVENVSTNAGEGFRRVLFASARLPGTNRVRVYGGLTAPAVDTAVLRFDDLQGLNALHSPILPHPNARVGGVVDLVYDPSSLSLRVEDVPDHTEDPLAAANALAPGAVLALGLSPNGSGEHAIDLLPNAPTWNPMMGPANLPVAAMNYVPIDENGDLGHAGEMLAGRFGHTATRLDGIEDGAALIWGGNVFLDDPAQIAATAGEVYHPGTGTTAAAGTGLPASTAFHTATALTTTRVLLAGGLEVNCSPSNPMCTQPILTRRPMASLTILRWNGTGFTAEPVSGSAAATIFHAAAQVHADPDETSGDPASVLITGGAAAMFAASRQIVSVHREGAGFAASAPFPGAALIAPRFGHAMAQLEDQRELVTGGLVPLDSSGDGMVDEVRAISVAEVIAWGASAYWNPCPARPMGSGLPTFPDGGSDAGPLPEDGGSDAGTPADSGVAAMDAGL